MIVNPAGTRSGAEDAGHLGDPRALAPEELALIARALGELADPPHRAGSVPGAHAASARASSASARLRLASSIISPSSIAAPAPLSARASRIDRARATSSGVGEKSSFSGSI